MIVGIPNARIFILYRDFKAVIPNGFTAFFYVNIIYMKEDKLNILLEQSDDIPHWVFCQLLAMIQWNV